MQKAKRRSAWWYWAGIVPALLWIGAWWIGWVGAVSLAGPQRSAVCDGTLFPPNSEIQIALLWVTPAMFGLATTSLVLLIRAERSLRSPNAVGALIALPVAIVTQLIVSQRIVGDLVGLFPHVQICGG